MIVKVVFSELLNCINRGEDTVLISIITEKGSAPRGCGAQMLVGRCGQISGTVGGGMLELKAVKMAQVFLQADESSMQKCMVHQFLLQEQQAGGTGMVCGGDVTMLFCRILADDACWRDVAEKLILQIAQKKAGWLVQRMDDGTPSLLDGENMLLSGVPMEGCDCLAGKNAVLTGTHFALPLPIGERVVLFGGGHCAFSLVPMLKTVGFCVTLVDCRPDFAVQERFPDAEHVICCDYAHLSDVLQLVPDDFVVIMTHSHVTDAVVQEWVLRQKTSYVGALGSKRKIAFINEILREKNIPEEAIQSVHSPIGMSIKAATPEEIAVSIAGEMIYERAVLREKAVPQTCAQ